MRSTWAVALTLSIGVASLMFGLSGYGGAVAKDPTDGLGPVGSSVQDQASNSSVESGVDGAAGNTDQPLITFILNGGGALLSIAQSVVLLPVALMNLGFPAWFAVPIGSLVSIIVGVGITQFIAGRVYR